jgi:hypothetical protein
MHVGRKGLYPLCTTEFFSSIVLCSLHWLQVAIRFSDMQQWQLATAIAGGFVVLCAVAFLIFCYLKHWRGERDENQPLLGGVAFNEGPLARNNERVAQDPRNEYGAHAPTGGYLDRGALRRITEWIDEVLRRAREAGEPLPAPIVDEGGRQPALSAVDAGFLGSSAESTGAITPRLSPRISGLDGPSDDVSSSGFHGFPAARLNM